MRPPSLSLFRLALLTSAVAAVMEARATPPNLLIVLGDDATYSDLPLYGGENVETPNIDRLAAEGVTFNRAYVSMSICTPCRTELYTGLYPHRSGVCWNHAPARMGTRSIVHRLGDAGYRVGIAGKTHIKPESVFPFELVGGVERNCVSRTCTFRPDGIRKFLERDASQPFCLIVALTSPHMPWTAGDANQFAAESLQLPPYLVDNEVTRREFCKYLAEIDVLDRQVGQTLDALAASGQEDNTMVIFSSEQGAQWPGCKWTNWEQGVHTGLVIRWPDRVRPETRTDALVQYADVLPTLLDAAGVEYQSDDFDGQSFLPVLRGDAASGRQYAFAMHNNVPEGPPYPIRSVTDGAYRYIWNLKSESVYIEKHVLGFPEHTAYWPSWIFSAADNDNANRLVQRYLRRPAEELYDVQNDPQQFHNLAADPAHQAVKDRLRSALDDWMEEQGDPGAELDRRDVLDSLSAAARGKPYVTLEAK